MGCRSAISVLVVAVVLAAGIQADACQLTCCSAAHEHDSRHPESMSATHHHTAAAPTVTQMSMLLSGCHSEDSACRSLTGLRVVTADSTLPCPWTREAHAPAKNYRALLEPANVWLASDSPPGSHLPPPQVSSLLSSSVLQI